MPKLPVLTPREIIKILKKKGFVLDRSKDSHQIYRHPNTGMFQWTVTKPAMTQALIRASPFILPIRVNFQEKRGGSRHRAR